MDLGSRTVVAEKVDEVNDVERIRRIGAGTEGNGGFENMMVKLEHELKKMMEKGFENIMVKFDDLDTRLKEVEKFVFPPERDPTPIYQPYRGVHPSPIYPPSGDVVLFSGVPDPSPPIIVDITKEETGEEGANEEKADDGEKAKKTKRGNKEKKAKEKKGKEKKGKEKNDKDKKKAKVKIDGGLIIESGQKRSRNPTTKFTPTEKKKQKTA